MPWDISVDAAKRFGPQQAMDARSQGAIRLNRATLHALRILTMESDHPGDYESFRVTESYTSSVRRQQPLESQCCLQMFDDFLRQRVRDGRSSRLSTRLLFGRQRSDINPYIHETSFIVFNTNFCSF